MKIIRILIFLFIVTSHAYAVDYQTVVYPDANNIDVITTTVADTVTVTFSNVTTESIAEFFLTVHSDDSVFVLGTVIDGNISPSYTTEVSDGTIYPSQLSTALLIGACADSVQIRFYTTNLENLHITFCGMQPDGFFGVTEALEVLPVCCLGIRGNIDGDASDILDIVDLVYFIDYSFGIPTGPAPVCFEEADVDASGELDIADIIHVVNYMFSIEGNVPPHNCP